MAETLPSRLFNFNTVLRELKRHDYGKPLDFFFFRPPNLKYARRCFSGLGAGSFYVNETTADELAETFNFSFLIWLASRYGGKDAYLVIFSEIAALPDCTHAQACAIAAAVFAVYYCLDDNRLDNFALILYWQNYEMVSRDTDDLSYILT